LDLFPYSFLSCWLRVCCLVCLLKEPTFCFIDSLYNLFGFDFIDLSSNLYYFSLSAVLVLVCFCFSRRLRESLDCLSEMSLVFFNIGIFSYKLLTWSLLCLTDSSRLYFHFHWILGTFWYLSLLLWSPIVFLVVCFSVFICLNIFWGFFCCWGLVLFHCDLIWYRGYFDFLKFFETCFVS
jgi:hypothetical protein